MGFLDWSIFEFIDVNVFFNIDYIRTDSVTLFMKIFTRLGDSWFLISVVIFFSIFLYINNKKKYLVWYLLSTIFGGLFLNRGLKLFFSRPRPFFSIEKLENLVNATGYSYPSGHSMGSIIVYLLLAYILVNNYNIFNKKILFISCLISLLIACSRVYLGVHYPTDIISGFYLGLSWSLFSIYFFERFLTKKDII